MLCGNKNPSFILLEYGKKRNRVKLNLKHSKSTLLVLFSLAVIYLLLVVIYLTDGTSLT